ncbi:MAG TPA: hypothetical protein VFZ21_09280 [Gemmatimonadaceae bacterium]|nr:hypothetical protein [Gemmatimonadaceae bacterium]
MHRWLGRTRILVVGLMITATGCARQRRNHEPFPIDGLRFFATAQLTGSAADSLLVQVTARNDGTAPRTLSSGICGDPLVIRTYHGADSRGRQATPAWDSELWRRATAPPNEVCVAMAVLQMVSPGDSAHVGALALPLRVMLGDSLPAGRYRVTARLNSSGGRAGEIEGGAVEFRVPPT